MRLFIAMNFDQGFRHSLIELQQALRENGVSGNFTRQENLHMTLAFIGDYGNPDEVLDVMDTVWFKPIRIQLDGLQPFRDMYFGKITDNPALQSYVRRLRRALADAQIPFDRRKFSPHITLIRRAVHKRGYETVPPLPEAFTQAQMTAERVSLMLSERGKHGMIYTELGFVE